MASFFDYIEAELDAVNFYPGDKKPTMTRNMRDIFHRLEMTEQDVRTLRGAIEWSFRLLPSEQQRLLARDPGPGRLSPGGPRAAPPGPGWHSRSDGCALRLAQETRLLPSLVCAGAQNRAGARRTS